MKYKNIQFIYLIFHFILYINTIHSNHIGKFSLIERSGKIITDEFLKGKIAVFSFIFTRCVTLCPLMAQRLAVMQNIIDKYEDVYLISITGDPDFDNTKVLQEFAENYGAKNRWLFLTGDKETIYSLSRDRFKLGLKKSTPQELKEGADIIMHSTKFVLVDENGYIKGYYDSQDQKSIQKLYDQLDKLVRKRNILSRLPALNTILNGLSAIFLLIGFIFIKKKIIRIHKICMLAAFFTSILFLISYMIYHYHFGNVKFQGTGLVRYIYFFVLLTHTITATIIVPLAIISIYLALKSRYDQHKKIVYITLPLWLYVSISGITIYLMLYKINV